MSPAVRRRPPGWRAVMALAAVLACMGCGAHSPARARVPEFSGPTMGTVYKVKVVLPEPGTADPATL
ncbi:MAG TPA: hypothetical protein PLD73_15090, partial [Candidatus Hydrogenedentes bacterium]|nr:hypothetical protein [Candidatus Hydrogenedentota bacterium]